MALVCAAACYEAASAAEPPAREENVLSFSTSSSLEVVQDTLAITLQVVRDGGDAATVQAQLKQVLDAALKEAKQGARPGDMDVRTGGFSLYPRYGKENRIAGWQGQAELLLQGKDTQKIAQTAGRLTGMNIINVGYSLSKELTERHEAEVAAQAIRQYRERAAELARQFGFGGYTLREVSVQTAEQGGGPRPMMVRGKTEMASMSADASVPVEPGKGTISATVSGSVQLVK